MEGLNEIGIRRVGDEFIKDNFFDDMVEGEYCYREGVEDIIEELDEFSIDVLQVNDSYFIARLDRKYYLVAQFMPCFAPNMKSPVFEIKKVEDNGRIYLLPVKSSSNYSLVQRLYGAVKNYYRGELRNV